MPSSPSFQSGPAWWQRLLLRLFPGSGQTDPRTAVPVAVRPPPDRPAAAPAPSVVAPAPAPAIAPTATAVAGADLQLESAPVDPSARAATLESLKRLQQIPALQSLARGFMQAATRADSSIDEVVSTVEKDPSLCVRVLKMANSAFVSPAQRIEDIGTAVQMLGLRRVGTLAHVLFTMRDARNMAGGLDWRHLWVHALATAAIAEELNHRLGPVAGPQLYLAALLHDVGKIVLSTVEPEKYQHIFNAVLQGEGRLRALELRHLGVDHGEAGVIFGRQARLPAEVIAAIAWHRDPRQAEDYRESVAIVSLANYLSKFYGLGFGGELLGEQDGDIEGHPAWAVLGLVDRIAWDRHQFETEMRAFVQDLKPELSLLHADGA